MNSAATTAPTAPAPAGEGEALLWQFIQHAPAAVAMFDPEMRYVYASARWRADHGLEEGELVGRSHYEAFPEIPERWKAVHRRALAGAVERCERDAIVRADGRQVWLQWEVRPWYRREGAIGGVMMFTQTITERIRMESALHASEERFRSAMENSPIGMTLVGLDGRLLEVNPALTEISGYTREELLARDFQSITHPDDVAADLALMREVQARRRDRYRLEKRYVHKRGHVVWIQLSVSLIRNPDGSPRHFVSQIQDITEQRQAEQRRAELEAQLRQAQKLEAIGTLAGGIAHDFNNILAGVMGNLQLAGLELADTHAAAPYLREAARASRRARDLVARILTFSRRSEQRRAPVSLGPVVEEALQLLRATLPATVGIRSAIAPDCPPVRCDSAQIHQMVLNLGSNAAAAMRGRPGVLEVNLRAGAPDPDWSAGHPQVRPQHRVRLSLRDTGHGMSAAVRERIFEPFFTTKGPGEGTGLGLAVVHGIMKDLGGAIVVESAVEAGTTFTLFFPAADPGGTAGAADGAGTAGPGEAVGAGSGQRILLVDDDPIVLAMATQVLRRFGYQPEPFASAGGALADFTARPGDYALALSDLTMPEITGLELARRLHAVRPDLPIVIATGYLDEEALGEMKSLPIAARLEKPYDLERLVAVVRAALSAA